MVVVVVVVGGDTFQLGSNFWADALTYPCPVAMLKYKPPENFFLCLGHRMQTPPPAKPSPTLVNWCKGVTCVRVFRVRRMGR